MSKRLFQSADAYAALLLTAVLLAGDPATGGEREDDQLQQYLSRLGLIELQIVHLEHQLSAADAADRKTVAQRLADLYANRLIELADDRDQYDELFGRIERLVKQVPAANTPALRVMLLQADYTRAEQLVSKWVADPRDEASLNQARGLLAEIAPRLNQYAQQLAEEVDRLSKELDEIPEDQGDRYQAKQQQFYRRQAVTGRAQYFAGWSHYYFGIATADDAAAKPVLQTARQNFQQLLDIDGIDYDEVNSSWLGLESVWRARAVIGLGLTEAALGNVDSSKQCFALLQSVATSPEIRDQADYWQLRAYLAAGAWDAAERHAREAVGRYHSAATQGKVSFCAALVRAGQTGKNSEGAEAMPAAVRRELSRLGLVGLVKIRQFAAAAKLLEEIDLPTDAAGGFYLTWLDGQQKFAAAERSKASEDYHAARDQLEAALTHSDAQRDLSAAGQCRNTLAWCHYRLEDFQQAADQFEAAATALKTNDRQAAAAALWMAFAAQRTRVTEKNASSDAAISVLNRIKSEFPESSYAQQADYQVAKLQQLAASPQDALGKLSSIPPDDPSYASARKDICRLLHQQWKKASKPSDKKRLAGELQQAVDQHHRAQGADAADKLATSLMMIETALGQSPADTSLAKSYFSRAQTAASSLAPTHALLPQHHYLGLKLARASNDAEARSVHANWLVKNAPDSLYATSALVLAAKSIQRQLADSPPQEQQKYRQQALEIYERLSRQFGDSPEVLRSEKNARIALARKGAFALELQRYEVAADAYGRLLQIAPKDRSYLTSAATALQQLRRYQEALRHWRTLLVGLPRGSDPWHHAKVHQLECLLKTDPPAARKVLRQYELLYPDLGNPQRRDKIERMKQSLE